MKNRFDGIIRNYSEDDVKKLRGSFNIDYTLAKLGSERLWNLLHSRPYVKALGALTGNQAVQQVKAGLETIYLSGWQVAADANTAGQMYPDQSLYPVDSVPSVVRKVNNALLRSDQIEHADGEVNRYWLAPIIADAEAGFGGPLNAYELMKSMIEAGAAGVHFEDQLAAEKKCGHLNSKVLIPTKQFIKTLIAARLAADVCNVSTIIVARTDAESASFITSDADETDAPFIDKNMRGEDGFYKLCGDPMERCIARGLAYAPYADLIWMETSTPNMDQAAKFAEGIHKIYPDKMLAYNCSPSFNWRKHLYPDQIALFQDELGKLGYKFQFITLAGFHALNFSMYELAHEYMRTGMSAYSELQQKEFDFESNGYTAIKHQKEVGVSYFDTVRQIIDGNDNMSALNYSTETKQF